MNVPFLRELFLVNEEVSICCNQDDSDSFGMRNISEILIEGAASYAGLDGLKEIFETRHVLIHRVEEEGQEVHQFVGRHTLKQLIVSLHDLITKLNNKS